MSCKSGLYAVNTNEQATTIGAVINFGNVVRRFGQNINLSGGNVVLHGIGYYNISASFTIRGASANVVDIQLYKNGTPITGAFVRRTGAVGNVCTLTIPEVMLREFCCNESVITAVITGDASTVTNATINVVKL